MKIVGRGESALSDGDTVCVSVSHELKIGRECSWVKYEVIGKVRPGEHADDTRERLASHVNNAVMTTVEETVKTIQEAQR